MKSVLISIQPKWCELIASGKKTVEVRKTKPKLETPFKCYIYATKSGDRLVLKNDKVFEISKAITGKVIGEFVCDKIFDICIEMSKRDDLTGYPFPCTGLTDKDIMQYLGNGKTGYGWHISNLVIYDNPRELGEFLIDCKNCGKKFVGDTDCWQGCVNGFKKIKRPPKSWCYVEG